MADIYYKGKPLAFYTRQDAILANPFVKADTKRMGQLLDLAKATAVSCGICSEKPYEGKAGQGENGVVQINRHNGIVLAYKQHPILGYVLSTYREDTEHGGAPIQRQYFYSKEAAFEDFALRSGLVDARKLFNETELTLLYSGLVKLRTMDSELDHEGLEHVAALIGRIEEAVPELGEKARGFDFSGLFQKFENIMER